MKRLAWFICICYTGNLSAVEILTVFSRQGLVVHATPDIGSKSIGRIPFANTIRVTEIENSNPITVSGITSKFVAVEYQNRHGYVFKGFLSRLPPATSTMEMADDYFLKVFGPGKF